MRKHYILESTLLIFGLLCVSYFLYSWSESQLSERYQSYKLDAQIAGRPASLRDYVSELLGRTSDESQNQSSRSPEFAPVGTGRLSKGSLVGRIEIPRIRISTVVREGADDKTLRSAAGHIPYTALPGQAGNVGIAAHRDSFFRNLKGIREGDQIRMVTAWGTFGYSVESLKIVNPEDVEVLKSGEFPLLTLVTCYPFNYVGAAPKRFIVQARQVGSADPQSTTLAPAVKKLIASSTL